MHLRAVYELVGFNQEQYFLPWARNIDIGVENSRELGAWDLVGFRLVDSPAKGALDLDD